MARGNHMGPYERGPRTGRGMGYCAGYNQPGYMNPGPGYAGYRSGGFGGHGYRHWFHATGLPGWARMGGTRDFYPPVSYVMTKEEEQEILRDQEKWLEEQLTDIRSRLKKEAEKEE